MADIWTVDCETRPHEVYTWSLHQEHHSLSDLIQPGGVMMFAAKKLGGKMESHAEWDGREKMIHRLWEIYDSADAIISYNGVSFDHKHFRAEWALAGLPPPSPWIDIDLLKTVRRMNLPSRKLAYATAAFGLESKMDPGGMETWRQIIRPDSEAKQLAARRRMVKYCRQDTNVTEQLFERLKPYIAGLNTQIFTDSERPGCTRCGSEQLHSRGWFYTGSLRYRRFMCVECGSWMRDKKSEPHPGATLRSV